MGYHIFFYGDVVYKSVSLDTLHVNLLILLNKLVLKEIIKRNCPKIFENVFIGR